MRFLQTNFFKKDDGLAAIELGLITPVLSVALVVGANLGFNVLQEDRITSAAYAGVNYLQDRVATSGTEALRPQIDPQTGERRRSSAVETARLIIQDAYTGGNIDVSSIVIDTECGCPQRAAAERNGFDETRPFYARSEMSVNPSQDICPTNCPDSSQSRVIAEINIQHTATDLFGNKKQLSERIVTRLR